MFVAEVALWENEVDGALLEDGPVAALDDDGAQRVIAEISGSVWKILVREEAIVAAGDLLFVLEAMKMEFPVAAPVAGIVKAIHCRAGRAIDAGGVLATIEALEDIELV